MGINASLERTLQRLAAMRPKTFAHLSGLLVLACAGATACTPQGTSSGTRSGPDGDGSSAVNPQGDILAEIAKLPVSDADDATDDSTSSEEVKTVPDDTALECTAPNIAMPFRFPAHILPQGGKSQEIVLARDYLAWQWVRLLPATTKRINVEYCKVIPGGSGSAIECVYKHSTLGKRTVTIPLQAEKLELKTPGYSPSVIWVIRGARVEGTAVHNFENRVDLHCMPLDGPLAPVKGQKL